MDGLGRSFDRPQWYTAQFSTFACHYIGNHAHVAAPYTNERVDGTQLLWFAVLVVSMFAHVEHECTFADTADWRRQQQ